MTRLDTGWWSDPPAVARYVAAALLVCAADRAQDVRQIVDRLNAAMEGDHL